MRIIFCARINITKVKRLDEEIPPDHVERFECLEKSEKYSINVMNYYYYY